MTDFASDLGDGSNGTALSMDGNGLGDCSLMDFPSTGVAGGLAEVLGGCSDISLTTPGSLAETCEGVSLGGSSVVTFASTDGAADLTEGFGGSSTGGLMTSGALNVPGETSFGIVLGIFALTCSNEGAVVAGSSSEGHIAATGVSVGSTGIVDFSFSGRGVGFDGSFCSGSCLISSKIGGGAGLVGPALLSSKTDGFVTSAVF